MVHLTAHYDGKVLVPDEPVELPSGVPLHVIVQTGDQTVNGDPILALVGLGMDIWEGVDPIDYQRREREGWE